MDDASIIGMIGSTGPMAEPAPFSVDLLLPGDCLLYSGSSAFSWFIKLKTWSRISHVEVFIGNKRALASRDGEGVSNYPIRLDGLVEVIRPNEPFDLSAGIQWYGTVQGAPYDWKQLFTFLKAGRKQLEDEKAFFCSEFANAFYRKCGLTAFAKAYPSSAVSPGMFRASPHFDVVWSVL